MEYVHLGRIGLRVSRLCLGTMNFGPLASEDDSFAIMDAALEHGITFFDTANVYGWRTGEGVTEQIIGRWLAQGGGRRGRAPLPRDRLRAEPLQPERAYRRARGRPRLPRAWDRAAALEPARGRPSRRGAPESERGTPRTRALAECGGEAPAEARGVRGALPGARRAAGRHRTRVVAPEPDRHGADHRSAHA